MNLKRLDLFEAAALNTLLGKILDLKSEHEAQMDLARKYDLLDQDVVHHLPKTNDGGVLCDETKDLVAKRWRSFNAQCTIYWEQNPKNVPAFSGTRTVVTCPDCLALKPKES